jgi:RimJ/RimL family protein N-acetyltransferase
MDDDLVPFAVIDLRTEQAVGLVSYMAIERFLGSVEIGHVTWSRKMKGTRLGTEAVWLLLKNAFEHKYRRLEWKCDSMNIASRNAAERLGFVWEGRLRQKLVRKGVTATAICSPLLMANGRKETRSCAPGWLRRILTQKGGRFSGLRHFGYKSCM